MGFLESEVHMKRKVRSLIALAFVLMFFVVTMPAFHSEAATAGWKKQTVKAKASDGTILPYFSGWKYQLSNGKYVNNCLCKIDGKYYLFKADWTPNGVELIFFGCQYC